jgi:hypothetical protein
MASLPAAWTLGTRPIAAPATLAVARNSRRVVEEGFGLVIEISPGRVEKW